jgi:hypothetical protein
MTHLWTEAEERLVRDNFPQKSDEWMGKQLGRTATAVKNHRSEAMNLMRKRGKTIPNKPEKIISPDFNRRMIFMAMILRGKKLLGHNNPNIDMDKLIPAFGLFESRAEMRYQ